MISCSNCKQAFEPNGPQAFCPACHKLGIRGDRIPLFAPVAREFHCTECGALLVEGATQHASGCQFSNQGMLDSSPESSEMGDKRGPGGDGARDRSDWIDGAVERITSNRWLIWSDDDKTEATRIIESIIREEFSTAFAPILERLSKPIESL